MNTKAYKFYIIDQLKVVESVNVTFNDTKLPGLNDGDEAKSLNLGNLDDSKNSEEDDV